MSDLAINLELWRMFMPGEDDRVASSRRRWLSRQRCCPMISPRQDVRLQPTNNFVGLGDDCAHGCKDILDGVGAFAFDCAEIAVRGPRRRS